MYYNYRYYAPCIGKWTKRDSIAENGSVNLYAFLTNNVLLSYDVLGMISPSALATIIGGCFAKCSLQSAAEDAFFVHLSRANLTGNAKRICETELRLPKPNEILGEYYTYNFGTNAINCLKDCISGQIPNFGEIISKAIKIEAIHHILSTSNFACNNNDKVMAYELGIRTTYSIQIGGKKVYSRTINKKLKDKLGTIAWCRCCNGL